MLSVKENTKLERERKNIEREKGTGFVGLFVGAVVLAVGYRIFMEWVAIAEVSDTEQEVAEAGE